MSYYLQMDGVDDSLFRSGLTVTKIEMDILVEPKTTETSYFDMGYQWGRRDANGADMVSANWTSVTSNGVVGANNTNFIPDNERVTVIWYGSALTGTFRAFVNGNNNNLRMKGNIYQIKLYNGDTLVAYWDMSTGTVQDQSGNGNHATLVGGTWVQDTPINPDPIAIQSDFSTKQVIFKQTTDNFTAKQMISKQTMDNFATKQIIRKQITSDFATNQVITATSSYFYDFSTKQIIHKQATENIQTKQSIFKSALVEVPAKQAIYKAIINDSLTKQILFKSVVDDNKANLIIFRRVTSDYPTTQRIIQEGAKEYTQEINLTFYINRSVELDFKITRKVPLTFKI